MSPDRLRTWARDARSGVGHEANSAGLETLSGLPALLEKPTRDWTPQDRSFAARVIAFVKRHTSQQRLYGDEASGTGWSPRHIALRNWGFDPSQPPRPGASPQLWRAYRMDKAWLRHHSGAFARRKGIYK